MRKKRGICYKCGAKKYTKFLYSTKHLIGEPQNKWYCKNEEKCRKRSANYRK